MEIPMEDKDKHDLEQVVLKALAMSLEAQLRAVRRLQGSERRAAGSKSKSQVDLVFDILNTAGQPLHISEIIERVRKRHNVRLDRESIVSALTKKMQRGDRFTRPDPNVFGLLSEGGR
jgi:hypothetical protein